VPEPDTLAALAATASPTGTALVGAGGSVVWASPSFAALTGVETPVGQALVALGPVGPDLAAVADDLGPEVRRSRATSRIPGEVVPRWFDIDCCALDTSDMRLLTLHELTGVLDDLGPASPASDLLTGLPGRDVAAMYAASAAREGSTIAVSAIDLDQYEVLASALGSSTGEELVVAAARLLTEHAPEGSILSRTPPSSFLLVFPVTAPEEANVLAATLRDALRQPISLRGRTLRLTASIGTAMVLRSEDADAAIQQATAAMLEASHRGGNRCVHHTTEVAESPTTVVQLWNALRTAIQFRHLEVWYQPLVSLGTGRPIGLEALCRWHHPQMGDIAPSTFIPLAEQNSEILAIGAFVLDRAGSFLRSLRTDSSMPRSDFTVVVNSSPSELAWPGFAHGVLQRRHGLDLLPQWFVLDIPEAALFADDPAVVENLRLFAEAGVTLSVDDFGTGMSTISRLAGLGVRRVTIDRRMVARIGDDEPTQRLVGSMIALANDLGFMTVAKGVETHEQLVILRAMGCRAAQGFLFAPAVTELEIPSVLRELHRSAAGSTT
jgi:diguanylate cyclase (GGDEF)-like protein